MLALPNTQAESKPQTLFQSIGGSESPNTGTGTSATGEKDDQLFGETLDAMLESPVVQTEETTITSPEVLAPTLFVPVQAEEQSANSSDLIPTDAGEFPKIASSNLTTLPDESASTAAGNPSTDAAFPNFQMLTSPHATSTEPQANPDSQAAFTETATGETMTAEITTGGDTASQSQLQATTALPAAQQVEANHTRPQEQTSTPIAPATAATANAADEEQQLVEESRTGAPDTERTKTSIATEPTNNVLEMGNASADGEANQLADMGTGNEQSANPDSNRSQTNEVSPAIVRDVAATTEANGISAKTTSPSATGLTSSAISGQVSEHILSARQSHLDGETQLEVVLDPPELGRVKIELSTKNEQLDARLVISETGTLDAIKDSLPKLLDSLAEAGISLSGFELESSASENNDRAESGDHKFASTDDPEQQSSTTTATHTASSTLNILV